MAALYCFEVGDETQQRRFFGQLQGKAEFGVELAKRGRQHRLNVVTERLRLLQGLRQSGKCLRIGFFDPQLDARLFEHGRQTGQFHAQRGRAEQVKHVVQQLQMHRAHGMNTRTAGVELGTLLLDAGAHMLDHRRVFAPQAAQLCHLLGQVAAANVQGTGSLHTQLNNACRHHSTQHGLSLAHHAGGQRMLKNRQATGLQQGGVAIDFGDQPFLGRHRNHMRRLQPQNLGRCRALPINLRLNLGRCTERVPQRVNFVEHHQSRVAGSLFSDQMLAPDGQVRLRHTGIGSQNKNDRMSLWNQADGQLRLGTDGIQAWRVQNHQALFEQRVGDVDQRMSPHRHLDQPVGPCTRVVIRTVVVPKPQCPCRIHGNVTNLGHLLQRLCQLRGVVHIKVHACPLFRRCAPLHQGLGLQARLDRQQTQARRYISVPAQFGGTHRGTPGTGRHDAAAIAGKKYRIDQLGLAARKLRDKRHHHLV